MNRTVAFTPDGWTKWYTDRRWLNLFVGRSPNFTASTYDLFDARVSFFSIAYSASPGMAVNMVDVGAKYLAAFTDSRGKFLPGATAYRLHFPKGVRAKLFWSVTVYDALTASGLSSWPRPAAMSQPFFA